MPAMKGLLGLVATVAVTMSAAGLGQTADLAGANIGTPSANIGAGAARATADAVGISFVDGMVMLDGHPLIPGQGATEMLVAGKFLQTSEGRAEVMLQQGAVLRLDEHSAVMLVAKSPGRVEIEIERGRAEVEVDRIEKTDYLLIDQKDGGTQIEKAGLYGFDANKNTMRVFDGEAAVFGGTGTGSDQKSVTVKGGHTLSVTASPGKATEFDRDQALAGDELFRWGNEREHEDAAAGGGSYAPEPGVYPPYPYVYPYAAYGFYPYGVYPGYGFYGPAFYGGYGFGFGGYYRGGYGGGFHGGGRR